MSVAASSFSPASAWNDKLARLLESTGDGIFGIDMGGGCTFINRAAAAMLGFTVDQALGKNMHDTVPISDDCRPASTQPCRQRGFGSMEPQHCRTSLRPP